MPAHSFPLRFIQHPGLGNIHIPAYDPSEHEPSVYTLKVNLGMSVSLPLVGSHVVDVDDVVVFVNDVDIEHDDVKVPVGSSLRACKSLGQKQGKQGKQEHQHPVRGSPGVGYVRSKAKLRWAWENRLFCSRTAKARWFSATSGGGQAAVAWAASVELILDENCEAPLKASLFA